MIVNSFSIFNYLLETDPRIRIFHHMTNMGCWRSRLDGILYSRGKYIILFDAGDLYEDNYVLLDAYNVIEKYNLDSCKFLFRIIRNYNTLNMSAVFFHVGNSSRIVYGPDNIKALNTKIFYFGDKIWNRLVRSNIYLKAILLLNIILLNIHKDFLDDLWFSYIINKVSYSYAIFERVGYVYLHDSFREGYIKSKTEKQKNNKIKEYIGFLVFDHYFSGKNKSAKALIVKKLKDYNEIHKDIRLQNLRTHFDILNKLLEGLIKDPYLSVKRKRYCKKLLDESKMREKMFKTKK